MVGGADRDLPLLRHLHVGRSRGQPLGHRRVHAAVDDSERLPVSVLDLEACAGVLRIHLEHLEPEHAIEGLFQRNCKAWLVGHREEVTLDGAMATFDQLAADQRAIIELVLRQGRSYDEIGEMLDSPPARVRELARDALAELAPHTAEFVDPQWRGQLSDYVLGQQTGPEAQGTRGHLRRSEPARIWAYSLLDALDDFYEKGERPEIPVGEAGAKPRGRDRDPRPDGDAPSPLAAAPRRTRTASAGGALSPAARTALMRRRILGGLGAAVILALLIFGGVKLFGGDDEESPKASTNTSTTASTQNQGQGQVVAQAVLNPIGKNFKGTGAALVYASGNQTLAVVRAKLPPSTGKNKYVLWLYNNNKQLAPLAADGTDKDGNFQGAAALPEGWENYRFIDVTYQETAGKNVGHGRSVMRGPLTEPQPGQTGTTTGTGTTPTPTPTPENGNGGG